MALSRPLFNLLGVYFEQLYTHPIRTKCISSCVIATLGNLASQYMVGNKVINQDSLIAFGLYGLLFGGTVPHYFYNGLDHFIPHETTLRVIKQLIIERLIYTPLYQMLTLYMLARFEGHSHPESVKHLLRAYWPILKANWKWLTVLQYINLSFVPPMLRVLVVNLIGFFWVVYISHKRRQSQDQRRGGGRRQ